VTAATSSSSWPVRPAPVSSERMLNHELRDAIIAWECIWLTPRLTDRTHVIFSARLDRSLGRCRPTTGRVTLAARLRRGPRERLFETLCHEVAHVAAYMLHGRAAQPHGPEWAALVRAAGFDPGTHARSRHHASKQVTPTTSKPSRYTVVHTCPVCQSRRFARRTVPAWRCRTCVEAGLSGELIATRLDV
jgi:predicted SprT family Zn-dependent metalloprotease